MGCNTDACPGGSGAGGSGSGGSGGSAVRPSVICEDFSAQEFRFKGTGGKRTFLGRDMTYAACLAKCQEQKVSGYCESRASSWGSCTYYAGGKREYAYFSVDSKTVHCTGPTTTTTTSTST